MMPSADTLRIRWLGISVKKRFPDVHGDTKRAAQRPRSRRPAVTGVRAATAGDGGDDTDGRHLANSIVVCVRDEQIPGGIHCDGGGATQRCRGRRPAVTVEGAVAVRARVSVARDGRDNPAA